ncbi:MAG: caspase domain-containing protein [Microcystaceae cyanobacterium]
MAKFALIIAIPEYESRSIKPLPKTTHDGETIARLLHHHGDYQITRLPRKGNGETGDYEMKAGKVTVDELYQTIKQFLEDAKGRPSLIYFTGHGFTVRDRFDQKTGYLATSDCQVTFKDNQIIDQKNGFPLTVLDTLIQGANLSELVVLLDCCYSGNYIKSSLMGQSLKTFEHKQNYYLITACGPNETAKTIREDEHSVFSGAIIQGLSQDNINIKGEISCDRLFDSINTQIGGKLQTPLRMGRGSTIILVQYSLSETKQTPESKARKEQDRDREIEIYRQQIKDLLEIVKQQASRPTTTQNINQSHSGSGDNVAGNKTEYNFQGVTFGSGFSQGDYTGNVTNNYGNSSLNETVKEIELFIGELAQSINQSPLNTPAMSMTDKREIAAQTILEKIETTPVWKEKVIQARQQGLLEGLKTNPIGVSVADGIEHWKM